MNTPEEIKEWMKARVLTHRQVAEIACVKKGTVDGWVCPIGSINYRKMPQSAKRLLLLWAGETDWTEEVGLALSSRYIEERWKATYRDHAATKIEPPPMGE